MKFKTILLTASVTLGLTAETIAQVPNYVPTNGLVGWWPFNGNANDESGNGNNGTVIGSTLTTDRFGNQDKAYSFNGNGNYIGASSSNLPSGDRSISIWFYGNTFAGGPVMLGYGGISCGTSFFISVNNPSIPNVISTQGHCIADSLTSLFSVNNINNWYHLVVTSDLSGTKHFINGQNVAENSVFISNTFVSNKDFAIGCNVGNDGIMPWTDDNGTWWNGSLDDIAIYNRALTHQEITSLYNTTITGLNPPSNQNILKVFPNPANTQLTIDYGNFSSVSDYKLKIVNSIGQTVFKTHINQQSTYIDISTWKVSGIYNVQLIDTQNNTIENRKIVIQ
jgi:hypothetical protein